MVTDFAGTVRVAVCAARSIATGVPSTSAFAVGASAESACVVTTGVTVAPSAISPKFDRSSVMTRSDAAVLRCTMVAPVPSPRTAAVLETSSTAMRWSPSWMYFVKLRIVLNFEFTCTSHSGAAVESPPASATRRSDFQTVPPASS